MNATTAVQPLDRREQFDILGLLAGYRAGCEYDLDSYDTSNEIGAFLYSTTLERIQKLDKSIARLNEILDDF